MTRLTEWKRRVALDFAQATSLEPASPEFIQDDCTVSPAQRREESPSEYAQRRARENDARALELQVQNLRCLGGL